MTGGLGGAKLQSIGKPEEKGADMIEFIKRMGRLTDGNLAAEGARQSAWIALVASAVVFAAAWIGNSFPLAVSALGLLFLSLIFRFVFRTHGA